MAGPNPLYPVLHKNCLTGSNFSDWLRNLRIVLSFEKIDYVLDNPPVKEIQEDANEDERKAFDKRSDDNNKARCCMLASMNNELQKQHVDIKNAYEMLQHLEKTCADLSVKRYNISKKLFRMRMVDESSVHEHVMKMVSYIEELEKLGAYMSKDLVADLVLQSLPKSFSPFITNFNMKKEDYNFSELLHMLMSFETTMTKTQDLLLESSKSSSAKARTETKTKIKNVQLKSKIGVKKVELKPKGRFKKAQLKFLAAFKKPQVQLVIKKAVLGEVKCKEKCFNCGKEGHLKKDCKDVLGEVKFKEKCFNCGKEGHLKKDCKDVLGEVKCKETCFNCRKEGHLKKDCKDVLGEVKCKETCFNCGKEGHLKKDCKDVLGEVKCKEKCFNCGKEGHLKKDCKDSLVPFKFVSVEAATNPDEWHMWKKPEIGWIKLNTDACNKGFGGLFRDHNGQPLFGYVGKGSTDDIYSAELWAILRGIELAIDHRIRFLWVESDAMGVVKAINKDLPCRPTSAFYFNQIWRCIERFEKFQISFSWRECNRAADHLSRMDYPRENVVLLNGVVLRPQDFPDHLWTIIKEDAEGRLYHRRKHVSTCQSQMGLAGGIVPDTHAVLHTKWNKWYNNWFEMSLT